METTTTAIPLSPTMQTKMCNNECANNDSDICHISRSLENNYTEESSESSLVYKSNETNCEKEMLTVNEIPESIKALDDILSEYEEPESLPPTINNVSTFQENHSEDDGYMSLNGRRCEINCENPNSPTKSEQTPNCSIFGDQGEIPYAESLNITDSLRALDNDIIQVEEQPSSNQSKVQNTLPKSRTTVTNKGNYSSLPCASLRSSALENKLRVGSFSGDRNVLGIDISAVHNAVLRGGVAKLPEPIVNEHPVTIYPGRASPQSGSSRSARSNLAFSVQSYKEVCRKMKTCNWSNELPTFTPKYQEVSNNDDIFPKKGHIENRVFRKTLHSEKDIGITTVDSSEEFSDESIEQNGLEENLTFSAPVTPNKRNGIAWEIKFKSNRNFELRKSKPNINNTSKENDAFQKQKSSVKLVALEKNRNEINPVVSPEFGFVEFGLKEKFQVQDIFQQHNESCKIQNVIVPENHESYLDVEDYEFPSICGSMLGKGTFVIRKHSKERSPGSTISDLVSQQQIEYRNGYINNTKEEQLNAEVENHTIPALQNLSRAHLSLNLDTKHMDNCQNGLKKHESGSTASDSLVLGNSLATLSQGHGNCNMSSTPGLKGTKGDSGQLTPFFDATKCTSPSSPLEKRRELDDTNQSNIKSNNVLRSPGSNEHISCTTPHRELVPPLEEDEEQCSESQSGCAPLRQIEHNISALLRGDIAVARICGESLQSRRSLGYRPGVHKSESAKEMLLSQNAFGPLPPSPPSSGSELHDCVELPPLPPSPTGTDIDENILDSEFMSTTVEMHPSPLSLDEPKINTKISKYLLNDLPLPPTPKENLPPTVPPHRGAVHTHTLRSRSIDSNYTRKCPKTIPHSGSSVLSMGYGSSACDVAYTSRRVIGSYGQKRNLKQSPREEHRLQTSCSLPETPIFARGCDIARTPHRRQADYIGGSGSRTAPRTGASQAPNMGSSIVGISGGSTLGIGVCRQRTLSHAFASGEMLRLSGGPARGWYPKQRSLRPASTEHIDRLPLCHPASMRVWDSAGGMTGTGQVRKPLTLPPNLTPSFLNKSPREALRRVTSLLINKKGSTKDREHKISKENMKLAVVGSNNGVGSIGNSTTQDQSSKHTHSTQKSQKKKGFFKQFWKKSKHYSLDQ